MSLAYDILDRYLYKEDVQQLARDRGLPTNRPKEALIRNLLASGRFVPAEALRYLNKRELRQVCQEYLLPDDGDREELFQRVLAAIFDDAKSVTAAEEEVTNEDEEEKPGDADEEEDEPEVQQKPAFHAHGRIAGFLRNPPFVSQPGEYLASYNPAQDVSREHPDTTAPWAVASIIAGAIVVAGFYLFISSLGLANGLAAGVVLAIVAAIALHLTRHRWVPWLGGLGRS